MGPASHNSSCADCDNDQRRAANSVEDGEHAEPCHEGGDLP